MGSSHFGSSSLHLACGTLCLEPTPACRMPETMEISEAAKSGDGTVTNVGIKMTGTFKCPECRQKFDSQKALDLHLKFQCSTAISKQINPIGDCAWRHGLSLETLEAS